MGLNLNYIPAFYFQEQIIDKDTAFPLAAGVVTFYKDRARTEKKPVYQISGTPPNYTYTVLPNPMILSSNGTFQDGSGNDIVTYFYPYDELGAVELYYVTVESAGAIQQFTREGQPNAGEEADVEGIVIKNYIPNGQFITHNDIVATPTRTAGEVTAQDTSFAQGGWSLSKSEIISTDFITFDETFSWTDNPDGSPKYALRIANTTPNPAASWKNIILNFDDVNKFASDSKYYTLLFTAKSNSGSPVNIAYGLQKYYGVGGDAATSEEYGIAQLTSDYQVFSASFIVGDNAGKIIGEGSLSQFYWSLPLDATFDISLTNFVLAPGQIATTNYPVQTSSDCLARSVAGFMPIPNPDGSDLYLPLKLTQAGMIFDDSEIGRVELTANPSASITDSNLLPCDGEPYRTTDYSDLGIPYRRLFNKAIWDDSVKVPRYGTHPDFITSFWEDDQLVVCTNKAGAQTATADGAIPTGFTFETVHTGTSGYGITAYTRTSDSFFIVTDNVGNDNGGNTFFASYGDFLTIPMPTGCSGRIMRDATYVNTLIEYRTMADGSTILPSEYGEFITRPGVFFDSANNVYFWYTIDGVGTDPTPGPATGIPLRIRSTDSAIMTNEKTRMSLNGWHVSSIKTLAGSSITAGAYFTFNSDLEDFYVWYTVDGAGTDPEVASRTGIRVDVLSSYTDSQVAEYTHIAINSYSFRVPDLEGEFLRILGSEPDDPEGNTRHSLVPGIFGVAAGTQQFDRLKSHSHAIGDSLGGSTNDTVQATTNGDPRYHQNAFLRENSVVFSDTTSGLETRPKNSALRAFIRY